MKEKLTFVELLFKDLLENFKIYVHIEDVNKKVREDIKNIGMFYNSYNVNCMNKNHGKTALKRKITYLRQELLNMERMLDE